MHLGVFSAFMEAWWKSDCLQKNMFKCATTIVEQTKKNYYVFP